MLQYHKLHVVDIQAASLAVGVEDGEIKAYVGIVAVGTGPEFAKVDVYFLPASLRLAVDGHCRLCKDVAVLVGGVFESNAEVEVAPVVHFEVDDRRGVRYVDGGVAPEVEDLDAVGEAHNPATVAREYSVGLVEEALDNSVELDGAGTWFKIFLPQDFHLGFGDVVSLQRAKVGDRVFGEGDVGQPYGFVIGIVYSGAGNAILLDDREDADTVHIALLEERDLTGELEGAEFRFGGVAVLPDDDVYGVDVVGEEARFLAPRVGGIVDKDDVVDLEVGRNLLFHLAFAGGERQKSKSKQNIYR